MLKVLGIGDNVCDKYINLKKMFPGGQALNFSVYCAKEGHIASYLGVFGDDDVSFYMQNVLNLLNIDITHCRHAHGENGYALIKIENGERIFIESNKGGVLRLNPIKLTKEDIIYIENFDIVHTSNNSYFDEELANIANKVKILSYDFSKSWINKERTKKICKYIDIGFISCDLKDKLEIKNILNEMILFGAKNMIATRGENSSFFYDGNLFIEYLPKKIKPIDTLGAGDSFAAGFLIKYGEETINNKLYDSQNKINLVKDALKNGANISAQTCMIYGAFGYGTKIL